MRYHELIEAEHWDPDSRQWVSDPLPNTETVEVNGLARPLYNSENGLIASNPAGQIAFWNWFSRSKIVDPHGRPLVVHRGDKIGKAEFSGQHWTGQPGYNQGNIFFSSDRDIAKGYTSHRGNSYLASKKMNPSHGLYSVYLKIERPVVVNAKGKDWSQVPVTGRLKQAIGSNQIQIDDLASHIQQSGKNDGLIVKNVGDQFGDGDQYIVFSNAQVKHA